MSKEDLAFIIPGIATLAVGILGILATVKEKKAKKTYPLSMGVEIVEIDGHEYITFRNCIIHKANCKFCEGKSEVDE